MATKTAAAMLAMMTKSDSNRNCGGGRGDNSGGRKGGDGSEKPTNN